MGRPPIGDKAMTDAERQRRHREKPYAKIEEMHREIEMLRRKLKTKTKPNTKTEKRK
jgi:hypothetical protein